jgi:predicted transcriptional regulator
LGSYRGRLDIIADILYVVSGNARKTQIMYQANLSFKVLQKYLAETTEASLINFEDERHCYMLTPKGRKFLEAYEKYSKSSKHVEKRLNDVSTRKKVLEELCSGKTMS